MSTPSSPPQHLQPNLTRSSLQKDLSTLLQIPKPLSSLLTPSPSTSTGHPPSNPPTQSALDFLNAYSTSSNDHSASQVLIEAYVRDMRSGILGLGGQKGPGKNGNGDKIGERDGVGERLDELREEGGRVLEAVGRVQL